MANQTHTKTKVKRVLDDGSIEISLPFRKTGEAFRGFETWEIYQADKRGALSFLRGASREEIATFERVSQSER